MPLKGVILASFLLCAGCFGAGASEKTGSKKLGDLPPAAQSSISADLGRSNSSYHAVRKNRSFRAQTLHRKLTADFGADGVSLRNGTALWKMRVSGYGHGDVLRAFHPAAPRADANRVEYRRGQLTEWYVNGPFGLEQGFTVNEPVGKISDGPLTVRLTVTGNVNARAESRSSLSLAGSDGESKFRYSGLAAHDAGGRDLRAWLDLQGNRLLLRVDDAGARYPVVIDPWVQVAELSASNGGDADEFGWSVGISDNVVVVGAPFHNVSGNESQGVAYVFVEEKGGWADNSHGFELLASDGSENAFFGSSVAISGNTIVVGAGGASIGGNPRQGAAYVFVQPDGGWTNMNQTAELVASDGFVGDNLGDSVSISGDTIVAGAPYASVGSNYEQGAVYVFVQPQSGWKNMTQTAKLTASDGAPSDILGVAVNIFDDTVVAGASEANVSGNTSAGAAYVFVKPAGGWQDGIQTAKLTASDASLDSYFGSAVDIFGNTIAVGAPSDYSGAVYVYVEPPNGWRDTTQTAELTSSQPTSKLLLGGALAMTNGVIAAGAAAASVGGEDNVGEVLVFGEPQGGWVDMTETVRLYASDKSAGDYFGRALAVGGNAGVTAAPFHNSNGAQGSAYIFQPLNQRPTLTSLDPDNTPAGGPAFTLTVKGSSFVNGAVVNWNDVPRRTTFVSSTELQASILASDISQPGPARVNATNPPPGGGNSNHLTFTIDNPVPTISALIPDNTLAGGSAFTLTVRGTNFVTKSKVMWNGTQLKTTYVSGTKLTASVPAHNIEAAGTFQITVFNPAPGGGTSDPATFTVNDPVPSLTALVPNSIKAGSPGFTLTLKGDNFVSTSQVYWGGKARRTTFGGVHSLKAQILTSDIKTAGTVQVTVENPPPGGGPSNALDFTIK